MIFRVPFAYQSIHTQHKCSHNRVIGLAVAKGSGEMRLEEAAITGKRPELSNHSMHLCVCLCTYIISQTPTYTHTHH